MIRPDHQTMAYGTLDYITAQGYLRSLCSQKRLLAHRTNRYALFADGDCSLWPEDNDFWFDTSKLGDRPKHDRCLCWNRNSVGGTGGFRQYTHRRDAGGLPSLRHHPGTNRPDTVQIGERNAHP